MAIRCHEYESRYTMGMIMYEREREQEKKNKEMYLIHKFYKVQTLSHKYLLSVTKKKKKHSLSYVI